MELEQKLSIIYQELQDLYIKDKIRAIKVDTKIKEILKIRPEIIKNKDNPKNFVKELYEDLRMHEDIDKVNLNNDYSEYFKKNSKIGRIDRKKAWNNLIYNINKQKYRLNFKELNHKIENIKNKVILPEDFDISQTAKIRDEYLYIKNNRLYFNILKEGINELKKIKLESNNIIIIGKNKVIKINLNNNEIDIDNPYIFGLLPLDTILLIDSKLIFIWK